MPYRNYTTRGNTGYPNGTNNSQPAASALTPAKPVAPAGAKPFPAPVNISKVDTNQTNKSSSHPLPEESLMEDVSEKSELNKTKEGKIKKKQKQKWSKVEKKNYINFRLRRMISPKCPVQILEELAQQESSNISYNFLEPLKEAGMELFPCEVTVNEAVFTGTGPSKQIAKNIAAEGAIHAFITNCVESDDTIPEAEDIADNAPWRALASLGLFKLFNDWHSQGYTLPPQFMSTPSPAPRGSPTTPTHTETTGSSPQSHFVMNPSKMPEDPTSKHPVMLLHELHPGITFEGALGVVPGNMFSMTVEVQDRSFQGSGRSKKEAKKACAMSALKSLHGLEYNQA